MNSLKVIHLKGTQAEMGSQLGHLVRTHSISEDGLAHYPKLAQRMLSDANKHRLDNRLLHAVLFPAMKYAASRLDANRPKAYRERSRAFMTAAGVSEDLIEHMLLMDVFQNVVGLAGRMKVGPFARLGAQKVVPACSSLMVWGDASDSGAMRHARNFDFPAIGIWDAEPAVVFCTPDEGLRYGYVTTFSADLPGLMGFNEAGLCMSMHTRFHRDVNFSGAGAVDLSHDIIRRASTLQDAVDICRERPVASTWGVAVSSSQERDAVVIETTGSAAVSVRPAHQADYMLCTNRNHHSTTKTGEISPMLAWPVHSAVREQRMDQVVADTIPKGGLTCTDLERLLGDHCDAISGEERAAGCILSQAMTVQSAVFEPDAQSMRVSVGPAPTGHGPYVTVPWEWDSPVGLVYEENASPSDGPQNANLGQGHTVRGGAKGRAFQCWVEACRLDDLYHDPHRTLPLVERAATLVPKDPMYRFIAGILRLRLGDHEASLMHFEDALAVELGAFRRGQLLLWGSRAAQECGAKKRAQAMRTELMEIRDAGLVDHRTYAKAESVTPFPKNKLRTITYNLSLVDAL